MKKIILVLIAIMASGCLKTRQDIQETEQKKQVQVVRVNLHYIFSFHLFQTFFLQCLCDN